MDNRLNEVRRKIRFLRSEMLTVEDLIRKQMKRDEDCTEDALRVMAMRTTLLGLISERNALGGGEKLLDVDERLKAECRAAVRKPKPACFQASSIAHPAADAHVRRAR